ncbi:hypothetical protein ACOSQ2_032843 [Xanthoceras sorbifolium]
MFQRQLYMKNELVSSAKKVQDIRSSNGKLRADVELLRAEVDQLKTANTEACHVADAEAAKAWVAGYELARLKNDFEEKQKELKAKEKEYDELFERVDSIACDCWDLCPKACNCKWLKTIIRIIQIIIQVHKMFYIQ